MTREERIIQLMAVDENTPTDSLDNILNDETINVPDTDEQWEQIRSEHSPRKTHTGWKVAATIIVICLISGLAIAAIHHAINHRKTLSSTQIVSIDTTDNHQTTTVRESVADTLPPAQAVEPLAPCTFEDTSLPVMLEQMARHYDMEVVFQNITARELRIYYEWNPENTINDVVNQLNTFQQFKITIDGKCLTVE
ncbi:MAG: DUF4974 domain-containing protein [Prevotella sp.]|nr:DUF4974 domain-containing protein [Prevotella sp.]